MLYAFVTRHLANCWWLIAWLLCDSQICCLYYLL